MIERKHALRRLLETHSCIDARETTYQRRMLTLLDAVDPFSRGSYLPGHFTSSAFVLSPDSAHLALIYHSKLQRWLQPGGHFEAQDHDVFSAGLREVEEEIGTTELSLVHPSLFDLDIHSIPARGNAPEHEHFDLRTLWRATSWKLRAGSDALACRWVALDEVTHQDSDESVMRAVKKLQSRLTAGTAGSYRAVPDP